MRIFCKHDWQMMVDKEIPSRAEVANESGYQLIGSNRTDHNRAYLIILSCKKCGKLSKTMTETSS